MCGDVIVAVSARSRSLDCPKNRVRAVTGGGAVA